MSLFFTITLNNNLKQYLFTLQSMKIQICNIVLVLCIIQLYQCKSSSDQLKDNRSMIDQELVTIPENHRQLKHEHDSGRQDAGNDGNKDVTSKVNLSVKNDQTKQGDITDLVVSITVWTLGILLFGLILYLVFFKRVCSLATKEVMTLAKVEEELQQVTADFYNFDTFSLQKKPERSIGIQSSMIMNNSQAADVSQAPLQQHSVEYESMLSVTPVEEQQAILSQKKVILAAIAHLFNPNHSSNSNKISTNSRSAPQPMLDHILEKYPDSREGQRHSFSLRGFTEVIYNLLVLNACKKLMDSYDQATVRDINVLDLIKIGKKSVDKKCSIGDLRRLYGDKFVAQKEMTKDEMKFYLKKMEWVTQARQAIEISEQMFAFKRHQSMDEVPNFESRAKLVGIDQAGTAVPRSIQRKEAANLTELGEDFGDVGVDPQFQNGEQINFDLEKSGEIKMGGGEIIEDNSGTSQPGLLPPINIKGSMQQKQVVDASKTIQKSAGQQPPGTEKQKKPKAVAKTPKNKPPAANVTSPTVKAVLTKMGKNFQPPINTKRTKEGVPPTNTDMTAALKSNKTPKSEKTSSKKSVTPHGMDVLAGLSSKMSKKKAAAVPVKKELQLEPLPEFVPPQKFFVHKNYTDVTAAFIYSASCSLIHFAMAFTIIFVEGPDLEKAKEFDHQYMLEVQAFCADDGNDCFDFEYDSDNFNMCFARASKLHNLLYYNLICTHLFNAFVCGYKELYEANVSFIAQLMKGAEVIGFAFYFQAINMCINQYLNWKIIGWDNDYLVKFISEDLTKGGKIALRMIEAKHLTDQDLIYTWTGDSIIYFEIEIVVFICFIMTLLILIVKSRCFNIGNDVSYQFEPTYMSYMVNQIIDKIDMDVKQVKRTAKKTKKMYMKKCQEVEIYSIDLQLKLSESWYDRIYSQKLLEPNNKEFVTKEEATAWITGQMQGCITKDDLDDQRNHELDQADMLTYQSIIYHTQSIIEMQIMCTMVVILLQILQPGDYNPNNHSAFIIKAISVRHILTYIASIYRKNELLVDGKPDVHGIIRAKWESYMRNVQVLIDWFTFGFMIKHMTEISHKEFIEQSYYSYWILIDCIIILLLQVFNHFVQFMNVRAEIIKNIYSLSFVQEQKIKSETERMVAAFQQVMAKLVKIEAQKGQSRQQSESSEDEDELYERPMVDNNLLFMNEGGDQEPTFLTQNEQASPEQLEQLDLIQKSKFETLKKKKSGNLTRNNTQNQTHNDETIEFNISPQQDQGVLEAQEPIQIIRNSAINAYTHPSPSYKIKRHTSQEGDQLQEQSSLVPLNSMNTNNRRIKKRQVMIQDESRDYSGNHFIEENKLQEQSSLLPSEKYIQTYRLSNLQRASISSQERIQQRHQQTQLLSLMIEGQLRWSSYHDQQNQLQESQEQLHFPLSNFHDQQNELQESQEQLLLNQNEQESLVTIRNVDDEDDETSQNKQYPQIKKKIRQKKPKRQLEEYNHGRGRIENRTNHMKVEAESQQNHGKIIQKTIPVQRRPVEITIENMSHKEHNHGDGHGCGEDAPAEGKPGNVSRKRVAILPKEQVHLDMIQSALANIKRSEDAKVHNIGHELGLEECHDHACGDNEEEPKGEEGSKEHPCGDVSDSNTVYSFLSESDDGHNFKQFELTNEPTDEMRKRQRKLQIQNREERFAELQLKNVTEGTYQLDEEIEINMDLYNLTIAANMTKQCSPQQLMQCLRYCIMVFLIQSFMAYYFCYEFQGFDDYQAFDVYKSSLRLICSFLLQMTIQGDINSNMKLLTFLKRQQGHRKHLKGRFINIALISMQLLASIFTYCAFMINLGQEKSTAMIIKSFCALGILVQVDNMFVACLPVDIMMNGRQVNKSGVLKLGIDNNPTRKIIKRIMKSHNRNKIDQIVYTIVNLFINIWVKILEELQILWFNYFAAAVVLVLQYIGYYFQYGQPSGVDV